jgi:hypothetical protein
MDDMTIHCAPFLKSKRELWPMMLVLLVLQVLALPVSGQDVVEQELRIPAPEAGEKGLEAVIQNLLLRKTLLALPEPPGTTQH